MQKRRERGGEEKEEEKEKEKDEGVESGGDFTSQARTSQESIFTWLIQIFTVL